MFFFKKTFSRLLHVGFVLAGVSILGGRNLVTIMPVTRGSPRQSLGTEERNEGKIIISEHPFCALPSEPGKTDYNIVSPVSQSVVLQRNSSPN